MNQMAILISALETRKEILKRFHWYHEISASCKASSGVSPETTGNLNLVQDIISSSAEIANLSAEIDIEQDIISSASAIASLSADLSEPNLVGSTAGQSTINGLLETEQDIISSCSAQSSIASPPDREWGA